MKVLGISGSPTKKGNNEQVIEYVLDIAKQKGAFTGRIFLSEHHIKPCINCGLCKKEKRCSQDDDMNLLYPLLEDVDAIIVSSPVYMGGMSGQMKCFFDRTVLLRRQGFLLKDKVGAAIGVGNSRNGGQELVVQDIQACMHIHSMIIVGDGNHFGGTVKAPFEDDDVGKQTVKETAYKALSLLERLSPDRK